MNKSRGIPCHRIDPLVICAKNHFKTLAEHDLDCSFNPVEDSVMGQLQVDRQHCVIVEVEVEVEVESYPTAAINSDMTIHLTKRELQITQCGHGLSMCLHAQHPKLDLLK